MVIRRVDPLSVGKVAAVLYAAMGLLIGAIFSVVGMLGAAIGSQGGRGAPAFFGLLFGAGAIIVLPILYAVIGFIGTVVASAIYNVVAGMVGGIRIEVDQE